MEPDDYRFPQIVISSGERQVWPDGNAFGVVLSGERQLWPDGALAANTPLERALLLAVDGIAFRVYLQTRWSSANSLWQRGWRTALSTEGGLPK